VVSDAEEQVGEPIHGQAGGRPPDGRAAYERWLELQPRLMDALHMLVGRDLVCWCALQPASQADTNLHALLLETLTRLRDARQERLLTAETTVPGIVWFVVIVGGAITIAFGSFAP